MKTSNRFVVLDANDNFTSNKSFTDYAAVCAEGWEFASQQNPDLYDENGELQEDPGFSIAEIEFQEDQTTGELQPVDKYFLEKWSF